MNSYPEGMPCWAPGAADYLASILTGDEIAWEWGGGASSVWLAPQVTELVVMESDQKWERYIYEHRDESTWNGLVIVRPWDGPEYVQAALERPVGPMPDLWLIDGYKRIDCLELVERQVKEGDIVVLDDALDYCEHLLIVENDIKRFAMPHRLAGKPMTKSTPYRNTVRTHHAATKETWIWQV